MKDENKIRKICAHVRWIDYKAEKKRNTILCQRMNVKLLRKQRKWNGNKKLVDSNKFVVYRLSVHLEYEGNIYKLLRS